ncbi:hypothetical protein EJB05_43032 [Eragrostis curvula]|uniref:Kinesin motor domain-containing protein n=1 Tax=Eragrostis curvula TaxID=38414 RepID=A0A5J9TE11_9POAL|nr:hypothetical protein EJB05_43032 [Eragrostis curvula]
MERIHVAVRSRPLSAEDARNTPWRISGNSIALTTQPSTRFEFDRIFGEECRTSEVYEARTKHIVDSVVRGFNGVLSQTNVDREFLLRMSYMEIYNEEINDLLVPEHRKLQIHESPERGIYVAGLREEIVTCPEQVMSLMSFGESHRHIGETNMNIYSSRSHTIFRMVIESREKVDDNEPGDSCDAVRVSVLNLVDLAGSERAAKTGAEGVRLKEGSHINKSLMTLGTVIKKLSEGVEGQGGHVPYRDSKLTRILQPALGGNANTAIICNITLAQIHADETKSSLQFASRALRVTNCACVNEIMTDAALLKRQKKEIEELRAKLRSELEKERIALELEEEKKAKEQRDRRLIEQAKKIENLSSLVLNSDRDDRNTSFTKNKRRVTWCPGPFTRQSGVESLEAVQEGPTSSIVRHGRNMGMPPRFEELLQGNHENNSEPCVDACSSGDLSKDDEDASLLDSHAFVLVTSRRRPNKIKKSDQEQPNGSVDEVTVPHDPNDGNGAVLSQESTVPSVANGLSSREAEAILVIKQLQDQIKVLELEKSSIQSNLDEVLELATQQKASFSEKYEELQLNAVAAQEQLKVANEKLSTLSATEKSKQEVEHDFLSSVLMEAQEINVEMDQSRCSVDRALFLVDELGQNLSSMAQGIHEVKQSAREDMTRLSSVTKDYEKLSTCLMDKICKLESEKKLLNKQSQDQQSEIDRLKFSLESCEKTIDECTLLHEMEKDSILSGFLALQKEVETLSSSALMKEKESIRKELEKTKTKLRETENKLKTTIQEKIKLQSEKAEGLKAIKKLESQRTFLERDLKKRDSHTVDKRHEMNSELAGFFNQAVQMEEDYQKLEMHAVDMKAEISSLEEALSISIAEKDEALSKVEILTLELEEYVNKLNLAESERDSLSEKIAVLTKNSCASESTIKRLEAALDSVSREKEDMGMQLTDALLDMESKISTWTAREKEYAEANLRLSNCNDELTKVRQELVNCKKQCKTLEGRLILSMENDMNEKAIKCCSEAGKGSDQLLEKGRTIDDPVHENELHKQLLTVMEERNNLLSETKEMRLIINELELGHAKTTIDELSSRISGMEVKMKNDAMSNNKEKTKLRMRILKLEPELDAHRGLLREAVNENRIMDAKYQEASTKLKKDLSYYCHEVLRLREQLHQS